MKEERAVHPIVPNKSLDVEGFTLREKNSTFRDTEVPSQDSLEWFTRTRRSDVKVCHTSS